MSTHSRWICTNCRTQLNTRPAARSPQRQRRFLSLADLATTTKNDRLELPPQRPTTQHAGRQSDGNIKEGKEISKERRGFIRRLAVHPPHVRPTNRDKLVVDEAEARLAKLFKLTGRTMPTEPITLRYSGIKMNTKAPITYEVMEKSSKGPVRNKYKRMRVPWHLASSVMDGRDPKLSPREVLDSGGAPSPDLGGWSTHFRWNLELDSHPMFVPKKASPGPAWMRIHVNQKDLGRAATVWNNYEVELLKGNVPADRNTLFTDLTLFLSCAVGGWLLDESVRIWRMFTQQGFEPNVRHWTMMLALAGRQRDLSSIKAIWGSIKGLRERPDNRTWSVLLGSLCSCKDVEWDDVAVVVTEMQQQWKWLATSKGKQFLSKIPAERQELYGPSIAPFNAALYRTLACRRISQSQLILNWIAQSGLKPSVSTFNILLDPATKAGDMDEVRRLLREVKVQGLEPDRVTFTIVLDGMIRRLAGDSDTVVVEEEIATIFNDMNRVDYTPSNHTYATALSALLNRSQPNVNAARVVLKHMEDKGIQPTMYVLTILVKYYMRPENPQVAAAEALYRRVRERNHVVDHRFYDAMIEGYAAVGETDKMVKMLRFVPRTGHMLSWHSMIAALNLLVEKRELDIAAELLEDLEKGEGMGRLGCTDPQEGERFWERVHELRQRGLLRSDSKDGRALRPMVRDVRRSAIAPPVKESVKGLAEKGEVHDHEAVADKDDELDVRQPEERRDQAMPTAEPGARWGLHNDL